jgi:asparagine synthase (glutamine-hydrolysing)
LSGFVGILSAAGAPVDETLLRQLTEAMSYCGPDHQHLWLDGEVGLGHALLAAQPDPPPEERQPCSLDARTWIAADARVDARPELIARLRGEGWDVAADVPDAHLILHAYHAWGERCLERLVGDFAFAIWDGAARRLFCARDHFGVIPFYYADRPQGLVFGNVLRALRLHPGVSDALNDRAIGDFLLFGENLDTAATTFADIRALPPAHALTADREGVRVRRHWSPPEAPREVRLEPPEEHVERFRVGFDQTVADRLRSARVAAHLSGGMDSTSVAVTAHQVLSSRGADFELLAYSMVFDRLVAEEEGRYADLTAAKTGLDLERLVVDEYWTRPLHEDGTWVFPEPGVLPHRSAWYEVSRRASAFSRELLTGFGGDPLFGIRLEGRDRIRFAWQELRAGGLPRFGMRTALRARLHGRRADPSPPDWIEPAFARRMDLGARLREVRDTWDGAAGHRLVVHPHWPSVFAAWHPGATGLPIRTLFPFFDLRLAQQVWATPQVPWRPDKRLLREAMRGRLPDEVLMRPKTPLYAPTRRSATRDPRYRIALVPEVRQARLDLLSVPAIEEYVQVERARVLIESPPQGWTFPMPENCSTLAYWLKYGLNPSRASKEGTPQHAADRAVHG